VIMGSAAFDIYRLVNFLPSQHKPISKYIIQVRGNISHRFLSVTPSHSRGRPMALAFFQQTIMTLHRPGSRSVIHGNAALSTSTILQFIPLAPLSLPHLSITMSASGDSQIDGQTLEALKVVVPSLRSGLHEYENGQLPKENQFLSRQKEIKVKFEAQEHLVDLSTKAWKLPN
jgi:hypothetical protein